MDISNRRACTARGSHQEEAQNEDCQARYSILSVQRNVDGSQSIALATHALAWSVEHGARSAE